LPLSEFSLFTLHFFPLDPQRKLQVESLLQRETARVLQRGLADPRIKGMVSVTKVQCSVDLKTARVLVSVTPERHEELTMHGLRDATRFIQAKVKEKVALRLVPHLRFVIDESLKKQAAVLEAIQAGMARSGPAPQAPSAADPASKPAPGPDSETDLGAAELPTHPAPNSDPAPEGDDPRVETS